MDINTIPCKGNINNKPYKKKLNEQDFESNSLQKKQIVNNRSSPCSTMLEAARSNREGFSGSSDKMTLALLSPIHTVFLTRTP